MKRSRDTDDENERRGGKAPRRGRWNGGRGGNNGGGARGFSSYNASQVQSWQRQFREIVQTILTFGERVKSDILKPYCGLFRPVCNDMDNVLYLVVCGMFYLSKLVSYSECRKKK